MRFRIAVLGATGFIGTPYRKEIRKSPDDGNIVAICGRRSELLKTAAIEDSAELATTDWRAAVEHPGVNLVLVCTPDALHHDAVMACARQGKHVFCEKPVGLSVIEAEQMWNAVKEARVAHFVPFWTRYVPVVHRAREMVQAGVLGDIRVIVYRWHNPRPAEMPFTWRDNAEVSSAGSIADVGSHAYDSIRWIIGTEATRVLAHAAFISPDKPDRGEINLAEALTAGQQSASQGTVPRRRGTAFDYASISFELQTGAVGTIILSHATFLRKGLAPDIELHGTAASLAVDRIKSTLTLARPNGDVSITETVEDPGFGNRFSKYVFPALRERIAGNSCSHPGLDDGYLVQRFTDAAARSGREGAWIPVHP